MIIVKNKEEHNSYSICKNISKDTIVILENS